MRTYAQLLEEAEALRSVYYAWATMDRDDAGYVTLCIEAGPRPDSKPLDAGSPLWQVKEAAIAAISVLTFSQVQAEAVWNECTDNGENVKYNIAVVQETMCRSCPSCSYTKRMIVHDEYHDNADGSEYVYVAQLECGHQVTDEPTRY